ncbi:MAG TPA: nickel pincer cofactor biosynthesis protein LarC [Thermoanaerobaculia bacterium]
MTSYHLDCASGIAGDMFLGACLDLGMPLEVVAEAVASLGLAGVGVESRKASRGGFAGTRFRVLLDGRPLEGPDPEEAGGGEAAGEPGPGHAGSHDDAGAGHAGGHSHSGGHGHPGLDEHVHEHPHHHEHGRQNAQEHAHRHAHEHAQREVRRHDEDAAGGHGHQHPGEPAGNHDPRGQRDLAEIRILLARSGLPPPVRERALRLFSRLGEAEAKAHGMPLERVHFHEVGAVDSIVDLVGAAAAVEHLAPERLTCGMVNLGSGRVRTDHGELPVPTPATAELLQGVPVYGGRGGDGELTTPTGAVLLAELVDAFVELPPLALETTGYGLGRRHLPMQPNALRLLRGQPLGPPGRPGSGLPGASAWPGSSAGQAAGGVLAAAGTAGAAAAAVAAARGAPEVAVVECEVDDLPGEGFGYLMERLLAAGALDVYFTPLVMKKSRPGTLVSMLCRRPQLEELAGILLLESGSLGCRYHLAARFEAERDSMDVETPFGKVRVKRGRFAGRMIAAAPEYEDCRRLALAAGVPWREVHRAALAALPATGALRASTATTA